MKQFTFGGKLQVAYESAEEVTCHRLYRSIRLMLSMTEDRALSMASNNDCPDVFLDYLSEDSISAKMDKLKDVIRMYIESGYHILDEKGNVEAVDVIGIAVTVDGDLLAVYDTTEENEFYLNLIEVDHTRGGIYVVDRNYTSRYHCEESDNHDILRLMQQYNEDRLSSEYTALNAAAVLWYLELPVNPDDVSRYVEIDKMANDIISRLDALKQHSSAGTGV